MCSLSLVEYNAIWGFGFTGSIVPAQLVLNRAALLLRSGAPWVPWCVASVKLASGGGFNFCGFCLMHGRLDVDAENRNVVVVVMTSPSLIIMTITLFWTVVITITAEKMKRETPRSSSATLRIYSRRYLIFAPRGRMERWILSKTLTCSECLTLAVVTDEHDYSLEKQPSRLNILLLQGLLLQNGSVFMEDLTSSL